MKKILLPVIAASLLMSGCTFHEHYDTYQVVEQGTDLFVDYIVANGNDWIQSGDLGKPGCYIYQEFEFPEITENVLNNGAVLAYLVDADGRDNILPYVFPYDIDPDPNQEYCIMQNIRFDVEKGILTIIIEWQDFMIYPQDKYDFKVCILQPGSKTEKK